MAIRFMTIHKSKGIEADCVLVLASSESQLFKWLEMNGEDMKSETDEDYRLGYFLLNYRAIARG